MSGAVSFSEAVEILAGIGRRPGALRAVRAFDDATGPIPFDFEHRGERAEVTLGFTSGVVTSLVSVRIGDRYSNGDDWQDEEAGNPLDELPDLAVEMLALSLGWAVSRHSSKQG